MNDLGLQVGDRVTYEYYDKNLRKRIKTTMLINENFYNFSDDVKILKVERPTLVYKTVCYKQEILDKTEKEYLKSVIKPFKKMVTAISKKQSGNLYFISISLARSDVLFIEDYINLPFFKNKEMYAGMKSDKNYTLKELGLE